MSCNFGENLLCCERLVDRQPVCKAIRDPVLVNDTRVLTNLLETENSFLSTCRPFKCTQGEISSNMRRILAYWMVEVCEEHHCQSDVFPLAMNLLDRYLGVTNVKKDHLQLIGAVCMFISSKLKETIPLNAEFLVQCSDYSITAQQIIDWELLVLHRLRWEVGVVTSHDFVEPLLARLSLEVYLPAGRVPEVRRQAHTFIVMCCTELKFVLYPSSTVAAASLAAAALGLLPPESREAASAHIFNQLNLVTAGETDVLRSCLGEIEQMIHEFAEESRSGAAPTSGDRPAQLRKPETPTDVREVHF